MTVLDCHDLSTTMASLAGLIDQPAAEIRRRMLDYDHEFPAATSEDPFRRMPRELLHGLGVDIADVEVRNACFFHGSRVVDPTVFSREGILPLNEVLERIWSSLFELVRERIDPGDWAAFRRSVEGDGGGNDGWLYRLKTADAMHYGPQAQLVREVFLDASGTGSHDYLGCPEIVQDIARCFHAWHGIDLESLFRAGSIPVIVKFIAAPQWDGVLPTAIWYAFSMLRGEGLTRMALGGFDGAGTAVPAPAVIDVERVR